MSYRWGQELAAPESYAVDRGVLYVADEVFVAYRLKDGLPLWEVGAPDDECLCADGGVRIGLQGRNLVRVWAPYNYDLVVNRRTGDLVSLSWDAARRPPGLRVLPRHRPTHYDYETRYPDKISARDIDGLLAWQVVVDHPWFPNGPVEEIPGGVVLMTGSGHLLVLDYLSE